MMAKINFPNSVGSSLTTLAMRCHCSMSWPFGQEWAALTALRECDGREGFSGALLLATDPLRGRILVLRCAHPARDCVPGVPGGSA